MHQENDLKINDAGEATHPDRSKVLKFVLYFDVV